MVADNHLAGKTVNLLPGEFYFGNPDDTIKTLLGSCVAITVWHPRLHIGGMCHYLLPTRGKSGGAAADGRYADEAMQLFLREMRARGTRPGEYQVKLYGAANMFEGYSRLCKNQGESLELCPGCLSVSCRNRLAAHRETQLHGFRVAESDLGGNSYRHVELHVADGETAVRTMKTDNDPGKGKGKPS